MRRVKELDSDQKKIVQSTEGKYIVLASAGSGKTACLISRIEYILKKNLANPFNILAVTFTNRAANEMKTRILESMKVNLRSMWVGTFHSICVKILIANGTSILIPKNFTIADEADKIKELKAVCDKSFSSKDLYYVSSLISSAKDNLLRPSDSEEAFRSIGIDSDTIKIYELYQQRLKAMNALDFDDLILETIELFKRCPHILEYYSSRFKYVLMDECQDSAMSHQKLILMLSSYHNNLMLVGDGDQSIYGWRGADVSFTIEYAKEKDVNLLKLVNNYRSQGTIVKASNAIIANNITRTEKTSIPVVSDKHKIVYLRTDTPYDEANFIVDSIEYIINKESRLYEDFAVLYRTNNQARILQDILSRSNIPTKIYGQVGFYDRVEIKAAINYIKVLVNQNDLLSFQKIANIPKRNFGEASLNKFIDLAIEKKTNIINSIKFLDEIPRMQKETKSKLLEFSEILKSYSALVDQSDHARLIKDFFYDIGFLSSLDEDALSNVQELITSIVHWSMDIDPATIVEDEKTLFCYIKEISLLMIEEEDSNRNKVKLMSVHSAKGLEFPVVFITGVEEDLFPHYACSSAGAIEEERRLFYVAMTRAIDRLFITSNKERGGFGKSFPVKESRFIKEIPEEYLKRI